MDKNKIVCEFRCQRVYYSKVERCYGEVIQFEDYDVQDIYYYDCDRMFFRGFFNKV